MLPSSNISATLVANTLGSGSNRALSYLCKHPNINIWSLFKPINYTSHIVPDTVRTETSGFKVITAILNGENVRVLTYDRPTAYYRLGDFRKYNHSATHFKCAIRKVTVVGAPFDANIVMASTDTTAKFIVDVTLPEIYLNALPSTGDTFGRLKVHFYKNGVNYVVGNLDLSNVSRTLWASTYANKVVSIICELKDYTPMAGYSTEHDYYLTYGDGYIESTQYVKMPGKIYRIFKQDPEDSIQWQNAYVILDNTNIPPPSIATNYIKYQYAKYLTKGNTEDYNYVEFTNIWHSLRLGVIVIEYKNNSGGWTKVATIGEITSIDNVRLFNQVIVYDDRLFPSSHNFGNGNVATLSMMLRIPVLGYLITDYKIRYEPYT